MRLPFDFELPVTFFEKADAAPGRQKRIGGIASTENPDQQNEIILQRGLDWSAFLKAGWFNDNHTKDTDGILGYPEMVQSFQKGDRLPNGARADVNGTWVEGYLLDTPKAASIWELGQALQKTERRLGFSVEGKIEKRTGKTRKTIAKALVRNVAITNCPVNTDSRLEILARSLTAIEAAEPSAIEKALAMGTATPGVAPVGPQTGEGAGAVLATESLEQDGQKRLVFESDDDKKQKTKKSLTDTEALVWVQSRIQGVSLSNAAKIVELTKALKRQGHL